MLILWVFTEFCNFNNILNVRTGVGHLMLVPQPLSIIPNVLTGIGQLIFRPQLQVQRIRYIKTVFEAHISCTTL